MKRKETEMPRKILWLIVAALVIAMMLPSCQAATVEENEGKTVTGQVTEKETQKADEEEAEVVDTKTGPEMVVNAAGKLVEKPKYGGVFYLHIPGDPQGFDDAVAGSTTIYTTYLTNEELYEGDWAKGTQGTGEAEFQIRATLFLEFERPCIAESWERPDPNTFIFRIRKGIYWHDRPPVNGRELTADDVVWTIERALAVPTHNLMPSLAGYIESVTAPDKWTVVVKAVDGYAPQLLTNLFDDIQIVPRELGVEGIRQWESVIGTGPFMMKDYVAGSSILLTRNPNYWGKDPLHPENKLPYLDGVQYIIITDASTALAAARTHKLDYIRNIQWEDADALKKSNPDMKWFRNLQAAHLNIIYMRLDKPDLPFSDIRVRRALALGLNQQAILEYYYGGNAELLSTPCAPYAELMDMWIPLEDYSESVQELYGYDPDKAQQLLAEAGYPNGFKTEILTTEWRADLVAIVKEDWRKIGVDLSIDVKEPAVFNSTTMGGTYNEMCTQYMSTVAPALFRVYQDPDKYFHNFSQVYDERCEEAAEVIKANILFNQEKIAETLKGIYPYIMEQCWSIETPAPYISAAWQPWVKGYGGEWTVGFSQAYNFVKWIWLDQDLKKEMTGQR